MDYYKLFCPRHPYEYISNFCADLHCLTGLCATCICEHTESHIQRGTSPKYENIKNTYTRYNQRIKEQIQTIEQDKEWLNTVYDKIDQKRRNVKSTLIKARADCIDLVNKHFDDLEANISSQILNESKKNSLHSSYRLENLNTMIIKEISNLLLYSKDLSSPKFLDIVKLAEEQLFPNNRDFHLRVSKELRDNQVYTANVTYRQDLLEEVSISLKRLINLGFLMPRFECLPTPRRIQRLEETRRPHSLQKSNSSIVLLPRQQQILDLIGSRRNVINFNPTVISSNSMTNSLPLNQMQQIIGKQNQVASPLLTKSSRIKQGLKIIRQQKKQSASKDDIKQMINSKVSQNGKQNESLAHSIFYDTATNFCH